MSHRIRLTVLAVLALAGCRREAPCARCDVIVIAATGEPKSILPPVVVETVGRDISDQIFERLADLAPGGAPIDTAAYRPRLAARWERVDPVTLRFHLRPNARWHDGEPVTAGDVVFSFEAFTDYAARSPRPRGPLPGRQRHSPRTRPRWRCTSARHIPSNCTTRPSTCGSSRRTSGGGSGGMPGEPIPR